MCLAVPGRIIEIRTVAGIPMGTVDFDGIRKEVCLAYLPEASLGDYTIVHVGFAISLVDEDSALETLAMFRELGAFDSELYVDQEKEGRRYTNGGLPENEIS